MSSSRGYVVWDTNALIRALAGLSPHAEALERMVKLCDTAVCSKEIIKEYKGTVNKIGMTLIILLTRLETLKQKGKLKDCGRTLLDNAERKMHKERLPSPNDHTDTKFIKLALAKKAKFIITKNGHLLDLDPYRYDQSTIRIVEPESYPSSG